MHDWSDAEHHVERAHQLYEAGRWDEAEAELREALALDPYRAEWHFNLALTLEAAGKMERAYASYGEAHELAPTDVQIMIVLGVTALRLDRPGDAVRWLAMAQAQDPHRPDSYIHRIEAYARLGEHDQAETMYYLALHSRDHAATGEDEADEEPGSAYASGIAADTPTPAGAHASGGGLEPTSLSPSEHALALANLAESLIERGLFEKAIWCLREASHLDPSAPHVHARMAAAYDATGRHDRARQLYLRELRERPGCVDTLLDLGTLLVRMGRLAEAGEKFRRVLELESDNPDAHACLGDLAARQGLDRDAAAAFTVVHRLEPEYPGVRRRLAEIALRGGDLTEARALLSADVAAMRLAEDSRAPGWSAEDMGRLGRLLLDTGMPAEAREVFTALVAQDHGDASALHHLGVACFQSGERAAGIASTRAALRREPGRLAAIHNLALAGYESGDLRRATVWLRRGLAIDPDDGSLRRLRTVLRLRRAGEFLSRAVSFLLSPMRGRPRP